MKYDERDRRTRDNNTNVRRKEDKYNEIMIKMILGDKKKRSKTQQTKTSFAMTTYISVSMYCTQLQLIIAETVMPPLLKIPRPFLCQVHQNKNLYVNCKKTLYSYKLGQL